MIRKFCRGLVRCTPVIASLLVAPVGVSAALPTLDLSAEEQRWLAEHPTIRLAVDIDWLPFEHIDEDRNYAGMAAEYIALIGEKLGVNFEVEKEKPWSEVVEAMKNRELDMYSCVVDTEQRREYVDFTRPYLSFPMVIVTSDKVAYVNGIKDLKSEKVAVVRGYATQDLLEQNHPELDLYLADNVADALEKLSHGQVYAYIGNIATVSHVIKREGLTNIKISGETPYNYELSMAVRNDWPEFVPLLQKALDSITEQERDRIFHKWIQLRYELGFDYALFWKVLAVVALILAIILIWNRRLSAEVAKRIEAEQRVQEAHQGLEQAHQSLEQINRQLVDYVDIIDRYVITINTNKAGVITSASAAFCQICGYEADELIGQNVSILRDEDTPESVYEEIWQKIAQGKTWRGELRNRKKNGDHFWVFVYISPILDEDARICGYTHIRQDITDRKRAEELSITDELTKLFNRRHFNNLLPQELARAKRNRSLIGLMILDVDYFKPYNDNYGHQQGDAVLEAVAFSLNSQLRRPGDFMFRIGGEEFAALVATNNADEICQTAEKLRESVEALNLEHQHSKVAKHVTVSIGLKICDFGGDESIDVDRAYRAADDALYQAKEAGRNRVVIDGDLVDDPRQASL